LDLDQSARDVSSEERRLIMSVDLDAFRVRLIHLAYLGVNDNTQKNLRSPLQQ